MNIKKTLFFSLFSFYTFINVNAQIEKVALGLKFNTSTKLFDCYLKAERGQAIEARQRIQFNSQISIVTPAGSALRIEELYMPLEDNKDYNGTKPMEWKVSNSASGLEDSDIFSIVPSIAPSSFYNNILEGEEVKLFSVSISPLPVCGQGVRLFENGVDPASNARNMSGGDFSNGFTIGGAEQKYTSNFITSNPLLPTGDMSATTEGFVNDNINLNAGTWKNASSFSWEGPNGFKSNEKNPVISKASVKNAGKYTLTVTNDFGCTTTMSTMVKVNAVQDLMKDENTTSVINSKIGQEQVVVSSKIYPNPATNFINLTIQANKGAQVSASIFGVDGKIVMTNVVNQKMDANQLDKNIPLKLNSGIYNIKVTIDGVDTEHRFICIE
jgi:hypothetical protein